MSKKIKERKVYENEILTVREVAQILRVNIYTVYDLLKLGRLTGFRITRRWRINKKDLIKFMQEES